MNITVLSENLKCDRKDLKNEHGLSLYIQKDDLHILFDTGRSDNFIHNAKKLGIVLEKINIVVISHAHQDHIGGLSTFLRINKKAKVYMKKEVFKEYYFSLVGLKRRISINEEIFLPYKQRICFIDTFIQIIDDIYILSEIEKYYTLPFGNKMLYSKQEDNHLVHDTFEHELVMIIQEKDGISIITGCGHKGVANIIETVKKRLPDFSIKALIGGFHLIGIPLLNLFGVKADIETLAQVIKKEKIQKVYTGHCTGKYGYKKLKYFLGDMVRYLQLGSKINI